MLATSILSSGLVGVSRDEIAPGVTMLEKKASGSLRVTLRLEIGAVKSILAHLQFTNEGGESYRILSWLTFPGRRIDSKSYFSVAIDGKPAAYIGILKKRDPPTARDYVEIKPGETLASVVSLSDAYSITAPGTLVVVYSAVNPSLEKGVVGDRLESNAVSVELR